MKKVLVLNVLNQVEPISETWLAPLAQQAEVYWYQKNAADFCLDEAFFLCPDPHIIVTCLVALNQATLQRACNLEAVMATSTAVDYIDLAYCRAQQIRVFHTPRYTETAVAEHAFALILAGTKHLRRLDAGLRRHNTEPQPAAMELKGKQLGIIGLGNIGNQLVGYAQAFGMRIVYYNRSLKSCACGTQVDLTTLLSTSDIVVMTVPLNQDSRYMIGAAELNCMPTASFLINIGADELIDAPALVSALKMGQIAGAALDVITDYHTYLDAPNLILTQSRGWYTTECIQRRNTAWVETLRGYLSGEPVNACRI